MSRFRFGYLLMSLLLCLAANGAYADRPLLTITEGDHTVVYTRAELEALPNQSIKTHTPYTDGVNTFTGPRLAELLENFGSSGSDKVTLRALNDYAISGDLQMLLAANPIIAYLQDGKPMSVRNKGPLWLILPLDDKPEINHIDFHKYMVWQLHQIEL